MDNEQTSTGEHERTEKRGKRIDILVANHILPSLSFRRNAHRNLLQLRQTGSKCHHHPGRARDNLALP